MKLIFSFLLLIASTGLRAQTPEEQVMQRVQLLNTTVFGTKDSATLDGLLASELTYGHSGGKLENRQEALHNGSSNGNSYANLGMTDFNVFFKGKAAIVRYTVTVDQTTNGVTTHLKLGLLQVWVKENKKWKMAARQAVKLT